jgi:hypothetical protein
VTSSSSCRIRALQQRSASEINRWSEDRNIRWMFGVSLILRPGRVREPRRNTCARRKLMAVDWNTRGSTLEPSWGDALGRAARAAGPPLLFGLRLWASVCLALYVAFWLEIDNASWAGTSAALVCQLHLGASLRKGRFRMIGTLAGAAAIVQVTAMFAQNRAGFLIGLAVWGGACAFVATLLRNFAAYAAALAGYTAAIIAGDELGATGGPNGEAFTLAITRTSEIGIGIVCAGIVRSPRAVRAGIAVPSPHDRAEASARPVCRRGSGLGYRTIAARSRRRGEPCGSVSRKHRVPRAVSWPSSGRRARHH